MLGTQAANYVQLVHQCEFPKAERKATTDVTLRVSPEILIVTLRIVCVIGVFLAAAVMDHEYLTRLFAVLFSLGCGMALLWEENVLRIIRRLFGRAACSTPSSKPFVRGWCWGAWLVRARIAVS